MTCPYSDCLYSPRKKSATDQMKEERAWWFIFSGPVTATNSLCRPPERGGHFGDAVNAGRNAEDFTSRPSKSMPALRRRMRTQRQKDG